MYLNKNKFNLLRKNPFKFPLLYKIENKTNYGEGMKRNLKMCLWDKYPLMTDPDIAKTTGAFTKLINKTENGFVMYNLKMDSVNVLEKNPNVIQVTV